MDNTEFKRLEILIPKPMWEQVQTRAKEVGKDPEIAAAYILKYGLGMLNLIDDCKARDSGQANEWKKPPPILAYRGGLSDIAKSLRAKFYFLVFRCLVLLGESVKRCHSSSRKSSASRMLALIAPPAFAFNCKAFKRICTAWLSSLIFSS